MKLPGDEIGISDIEQYRDCPQRMALGMRRHVELPDRFRLYEGERDEAPEAESYPTAYGHATHAVIALVEEESVSDEEAIDRVWPEFQHHLEPGDIDRLKSDLQVYRTRSQTGYRLLGVEIELRMPLFEHEGRMVYFRGRIDALYQRIDNPKIFLTRDYKSSRWPKSTQEVHNDRQQWSYNALVHYNYPECETLIQVYDQLRYGEIPTRKSQQQRSQIFRWLVLQVKAILGDDTLAPKQNQWCPYCPLVTDCRETHRSTNWWKAWLAASAPEVKDGRKIAVTLDADHVGLDFYVERLPDAKQTVKTLERFVEAVEGALKDLPEDRRRELGYELAKARSRSSYDATAMRRIHEMLGDDFYHLAGISKSGLSEFYGEDDARVAEISDMATSTQTAPSLKPAKKP